MTKFFTLFSCLICLAACSNSASNEYADETYCAKIEYYYPNTGTRSTYTLTVEIENDELTAIYWPNGGWLDDSHFSPADISDGCATFESDRGYEYTVEIIGEEDDCQTIINSVLDADDDELFFDEEDNEDWE